MRQTATAGFDWRGIERILRQECELYAEYILLTKEERRWITKLNSPKLEELTAKRNIITDLLLQAQDKRLEEMRKFPDSEGKRLGEIVRKHAPIREAKVLLPLINRLRALVEEARTEGAQFGQIVGFSMNLVNGVLSILWNATQNLVRSYGRSGEINENKNPAGTRSSTILKRA